jgi:hypothetical protein
MRWPIWGVVVLVACGKESSKPPAAKRPARAPDIRCAVLVPETVRTSLGVPKKVLEMLSATPPAVERPQLTCQFGSEYEAVETKNLAVTMNCVPRESPDQLATLREAAAGRAVLEHDACLVVVRGTGLARDDAAIAGEIGAALQRR